MKGSVKREKKNIGAVKGSDTIRCARHSYVACQRLWTFLNLGLEFEFKFIRICCCLVLCVYVAF